MIGYTEFPIPKSRQKQTDYSTKSELMASLVGSADLIGQLADPSYELARDRAYSINKAIWDAQGGNFVPVGVGADKVEQSYPLAKTLSTITTDDSEFISQRKS